MNFASDLKSGLPLMLICCLLAAALSMLGFWGWIRYGSAIVLSAGESALSWCF